MTKWEYCFIRFDVYGPGYSPTEAEFQERESELNSYGEDGWEAFAVASTGYTSSEVLVFFKRPKPAN